MYEQRDTWIMEGDKNGEKELKCTEREREILLTMWDSDDTITIREGTDACQ